MLNVVLPLVIRRSSDEYELSWARGTRASILISLLMSLAASVEINVIEMLLALRRVKSLYTRELNSLVVVIFCRIQRMK